MENLKSSEVFWGNTPMVQPGQAGQEGTRKHSRRRLHQALAERKAPLSSRVQVQRFDEDHECLLVLGNKWPWLVHTYDVSCKGWFRCIKFLA